MIVLYLLGFGLFVVGCALLAVAFDAVIGNPRVREGRRGMVRSHALEVGGAFKMVEPMVRKLAPLCEKITPNPMLHRASSVVERSGFWLGLDGIEFIALSTICAPIGLLLGLFIGESLEMKGLGGLLGVTLGAGFPLLRINNATLTRHTAIGRALPAAIDLAALCMAAGLDFSASIRAIVQQSRGRRTPLIEEFEQILRSLELGHTRSHALADFARATPIAAVEEFTAAVTQAEQKGTPLSEVLQIQASTLRMRRSIAAEEAASRAAVMLVIPLLLLMGSILLILVGPFIINGFGI